MSKRKKQNVKKYQLGAGIMSEIDKMTNAALSVSGEPGVSPEAGGGGKGLSSLLGMLGPVAGILGSVGVGMFQDWKTRNDYQALELMRSQQNFQDKTVTANNGIYQDGGTVKPQKKRQSGKGQTKKDPIYVLMYNPGKDKADINEEDLAEYRDEYTAQSPFEKIRATEGIGKFIEAAINDDYIDKGEEIKWVREHMSPSDKVAKEELSYADDTFVKEFGRAGKKALSKMYSKVIPLEVRTGQIEQVLSSIPEESNIMFMDHSGEKMFGIPAEEFVKKVGSRNPKECIGGTCYGERFFRPYFNKYASKTETHLPKDQWVGFDLSQTGMDSVLPKMPSKNRNMRPFVLRDRYARQNMGILTSEDVPWSGDNVISPYIHVEDDFNREGGGFINESGYTPGEDSFNNPFNIIPSNNITMRNTPFPVLAIPNKGKARILQPGISKALFKEADYVTEIPMSSSPGKKQNGGIIKKFQNGGFDYVKVRNPLYKDSLDLYNENRFYRDFVKNQIKLYGRNKFNSNEEHPDEKYLKYYPQRAALWDKALKNLTKANKDDPDWRGYGERLYEVVGSDLIGPQVYEWTERVKPTHPFTMKKVPKKSPYSFVPIPGNNMVSTEDQAPPKKIIEYYDNEKFITRTNEFLDKFPTKKSGGGGIKPPVVVKRGFDASSVMGNVIEANNFRVSPSALDLHTWGINVDMPNRFSTPSSYPNDINAITAHAALPPLIRKILQDKYAELPSSYYSSMRGPNYDPIISDNTSAAGKKELDSNLLYKHYQSSKKENGGYVKGKQYELTDEQITKLKRLGYKVKYED